MGRVGSEPTACVTMACNKLYDDFYNSPSHPSILKKMQNSIFFYTSLTVTTLLGNKNLEKVMEGIKWIIEIITSVLIAFFPIKIISQ